MNVRTLMTKNLEVINHDSTCLQAAATMRDSKVGDVLIRGKDGKLCGILTDRDLVVRCIAEGHDPATMNVLRMCSANLVTLTPDQDVDEAIKLMGQNKVRRLPVVENNEVVGIISIGDLAAHRQPESLLGQISRAPANTLPTARA